jgi:hypothetical protein
MKMMEAAVLSEISVYLYSSVFLQVFEYSALPLNCCENFRFQIAFEGSFGSGDKKRWGARVGAVF